MNSKTKYGSANRRLGYNDRAVLTYDWEYLYKGSLFIGQSNEEVEVIYDTSSDWLVIEGQECNSCTGNGFD